MKKSTAAYAAIIVMLSFTIDRLVKNFVTLKLELGESMPLIPGLVELFRLHNYGAAWSSFSGMRWLLVAITSAALIILAILLIRGVVRHPFGVVAVALIIGGGLGNLADRIVMGYVVDMFNLQFMSYPVFNVADIAVVIGGIMAIIYYLFIYDKCDNRRKK